MPRPEAPIGDVARKVFHRAGVPGKSPIGPDRRWTFLADVTCALVAAPPSSFAATVIAVTATALPPAPIRHDGAQSGLRVAEQMTLDFLDSASNAILIGSSGLGKTMMAQNIAHQAVLQGRTVLFATAGQLLGELAGLDSDSALRYRLRRYAAPDLLVIDEVGYLSYSNRHADLLFELINRRHEKTRKRAL